MKSDVIGNGVFRMVICVYFVCVRACVFWRAIVSSLMSEILNQCSDPSERCWFSLACQISRLPACGKPIRAFPPLFGNLEQTRYYIRSVS